MDRRMSVKWVLAAAAAGCCWRASGAGSDHNGSGVSVPTLIYKIYRPGLVAVDADSLRASDRRRSVRSDRSRGCTLPQCFSGGGGRLSGRLGERSLPANSSRPAEVAEGFVWLDRESRRRGGTVFVRLPVSGQTSICQRYLLLAAAKPPVQKLCTALRTVSRSDRRRLLCERQDEPIFDTSKCARRVTKGHLWKCSNCGTHVISKQVCRYSF